MPHRDLKLDYHASLENQIGTQGVSLETLETSKAVIQRILQQLCTMKELGQMPFLHLPEDQDNASFLQELTQQLKQKFVHCVVLGIGGSALGARALLQALKPEYFFSWIECPVKVVDFIDPVWFDYFLNHLSLEKTLFVVISKSGETIETRSQLAVIERALQTKLGEHYRQHLLFITDPHQGFLRNKGQAESIRCLDLHPGVGGRYSILTSVGLFPAAFAGINILEILAGARQMLIRCLAKDLWLNPAALLATLIVQLNQQKQKNILVLLPYSERLLGFAEWFSQLWAESLGKKNSLSGKEVYTGTTPAIACGPRDQHSQLQLYSEGPFDKLILFFRILNFQETVTLPKLTEKAGIYPQSLAELLEVESIATQNALMQVGRPSATLLLHGCDEYQLGQLVILLELTTVIAGSLYDVNPFDQPGVELGKKFIPGLLAEKKLPHLPSTGAHKDSLFII